MEGDSKREGVTLMKGVVSLGESAAPAWVSSGQHWRGGHFLRVNPGHLRAQGGARVSDETVEFHVFTEDTGRCGSSSSGSLTVEFEAEGYERTCF